MSSQATSSSSNGAVTSQAGAASKSIAVGAGAALSFVFGLAALFA